MAAGGNPAPFAPHQLGRLVAEYNFILIGLLMYVCQGRVGDYFVVLWSHKPKMSINFVVVFKIYLKKIVLVEGVTVLLCDCFEISWEKFAMGKMKR